MLLSIINILHPKFNLSIKVTLLNNINSTSELEPLLFIIKDYM